MTASFPLPLAALLPRGAVASIPLPECGSLPADIACMCGVGRAFPAGGGQALAGVALEEMHERCVGGDECGRGSIAHVTLRDAGNLNRVGDAVTWQPSGKLPC